jgi:putative solute:sodium symporter small subunit
MIEIGLGLFLVAVLAAMLSGVGRLVPGGESIDLIPLLGIEGVALILAVAALLIASGMVRNALRAHPERAHALRTARLTVHALLATAGFAIGIPFVVGPANLVRIDGMPLGYYAAAQASLLALVVVAFVWAGRQRRIDAARPDNE